MTELMTKVAAELTSHGFEVHTADTAEAARALILSLIPKGATIGAGGSVTIRDLGVVDELLARGHDVAWHWLPHDDQKELFRRAASADVYLTSSNAVTADGQLVNIDRTGNRVAAMAHGPAMVIAAVGVNKLVNGGVNAAIARIKAEACPPNARRLNIDTPCARTGKCNEAACGDASLCGVTSITKRPMRGRRYVVVLIDQNLGY